MSVSFSHRNPSTKHLSHSSVESPCLPPPSLPCLSIFFQENSPSFPLSNTKTIPHDSAWMFPVLQLLTFPQQTISINSIPPHASLAYCFLIYSPYLQSPSSSSSLHPQTMSNIEGIHPYKRRAKTPSFSSILLDAIYRSIDGEGEGDAASYHHECPPTATKYDIPSTNHECHSKNYSAGSKQRRSRMRSDSTFETLDLRHAIMIESWMEKHEHNPPPQQPYHHDRGNNVDDEKIRIVRQKSVPSKSTDTTASARNFSKIRANLASRAADNCFAPAAKGESSSRIFTKTKTRAMKIYDELKKPRSPQNQAPVSPGARIAAFINSLFRNSGDRKPNPPPPAATPSTSCSSASSRSCLSNKTSSSRGKTRSVRFYPVSVIVDEDSRPCGHKSLQKEDETTRSKLQGENPKWRREKEIDSLMKMVKRKCRDQVAAAATTAGGASSSFFVNGGNDESDEDMNDGESCASSDLFELENLSSIGVTVSRYAEELPVYGTTSLHKLKT